MNPDGSRKSRKAVFYGEVKTSSRPRVLLKQVIKDALFGHGLQTVPNILLAATQRNAEDIYGGYQGSISIQSCLNALHNLLKEGHVQRLVCNMDKDTQILNETANPMAELRSTEAALRVLVMNVIQGSASELSRAADASGFETAKPQKKSWALAGLEEDENVGDETPGEDEEMLWKEHGHSLIGSLFWRNGVTWKVTAWRETSLASSQSSRPGFKATLQDTDASSDQVLTCVIIGMH